MTETTNQSATAENAEQSEITPDAVAELEAEVARLTDQHLRALAEQENLRRRAAREREDAVKYAATGFARDLLTVADNLRRALDSLPEEQVKDEAIRNVLTGVEATERELLGVFERHGIKPVAPLGDKFDHNLHQAIFEVPGTGKPAGTVVQVLQPGYVLNDRLLRPAMVGVAKGDGASATAEAEAKP